MRGKLHLILFCALLALGALWGSACSNSDVGNPCFPSNVDQDGGEGLAIISTDLNHCEDLICIQIGTDDPAYCSKDCSQDRKCPEEFECKMLISEQFPVSHAGEYFCARTGTVE